MFIDREMFLSAKLSQTKKVPLPEFGEDAHVYVRTLTPKEQDIMDLHGQDMKEGDPEGVNIRALYAQKYVCSKEGNPIFLSTPSELKALGNIQGGSATLSKILDAAMELGGKTVKAHEEIAKNSEATPDSDSPTSLPKLSEKPSQS